jgi:hypothetical protein
MPLPSRPDRAVLCAGLSQAFVAQVFKVPLKGLAAPTRAAPKVAFARQVAMYLTHTVFKVSLTRTGAAFGRDRTTASYACRVIEEAREDESLDDAVEGIAAMLRAVEPRSVRSSSPVRNTRPARNVGEQHAVSIDA